MKTLRQSCDIDSNVRSPSRYLEAAHLLYETTIFDFSWNLWLISNFRKVISACHFACISHVNIAMVGTGETLTKRADKDNNNGQTLQWFLIWETLAAMDNLQWLRFEVMLLAHDVYVRWWTANLERVLRPVKMVTKPAHFELILPFDVGDWAQELPCQVIQSEAKDAWK
jgi:hypothetical protein